MKLTDHCGDERTAAYRTECQYCGEAVEVGEVFTLSLYVDRFGVRTLVSDCLVCVDE